MAYLKKNIAILTLFGLVWANLAWANDFASIHQTESDKYKDVKVEQGNDAGNSASGELSSPAVGRTVFGFYPYWMGTAYSNFQWDLLTHIAYFSLEVNSDGSFADKHGWPVTVLLDLAHQNDVKLVLVTQNFTGSDLTTLLSSTTNRNNLINNLLNEVQTTGADGINIDFENVPGAQKTNLTTFMTDLTNAFKAVDSEYHITIDVPAVDWNDAFDEYVLANVTDGLMIMGYDYHWSTASQAGPVAPYSTSSTWGALNVFNTVDTYMQATLNNKDKIILGVPYYGYDWPVSADTVPANTTDTAESRTYVENRAAILNYTRIWDNESNTPYYKYGSFRQTWYEDQDSLQYKYNLVNAQDLAGVGIWALGYDGTYTELWDKLRSNFAGPQTYSTPAGSTYRKYKKITLVASDLNGVAGTYYTTDGSESTESSTLYTKPFRIFTDTELNFFSVDVLGNGESVKTEDYVMRYNNDKSFRLRKGMKNVLLYGKQVNFKFKKLPKKPKKYWWQIKRINKKPKELDKKKTLKGYWKINTTLNKLKNKKRLKLKMVFRYKKKLLKKLDVKKKDLRLKYYNRDSEKWETISAKHLKKKRKFRFWTDEFKWKKNKYALGSD